MDFLHGWNKSDHHFFNAIPRGHAGPFETPGLATLNLYADLVWQSPSLVFKTFAAVQHDGIRCMHWQKVRRKSSERRNAYFADCITGRARTFKMGTIGMPDRDSVDTVSCTTELHH